MSYFLGILGGTIFIVFSITALVTLINWFGTLLYSRRRIKGMYVGPSRFDTKRKIFKK